MKKRTKILTNKSIDVKIHLPWDEDPTEARRIYMRLYREVHKTNLETALRKELGIKPNRKKK
jgi:hypothetical protein